MDEKIITPKDKVYEIFTCSGNRVMVKGTDIMTDFQAGDLTILNAAGEHVAQFELMNIEGWRVAP